MSAEPQTVEAEEMGWDDFRRFFRRRWKPGEHVVVIGRTGSGKSILQREILNLKPKQSWVVLDGKRGLDPSLELGEGWRTLRTWDGPFHKAANIGTWVRELWGGEEREPFRARLIGPKMKGNTDFAKLAPEFIRALSHVRWHQKPGQPLNIAVDEMQILAAPKREGGLNLGTEWISPLLREIRFTGASVLTGTQYPVWIGKSTYRETTHRFLFRPADEESADQIGKIGGDRRAVIPLMDSLHKFEFLYLDADDERRRYRISKVDLPRG